jgi:hypothetical protein
VSFSLLFECARRSVPDTYYLVRKPGDDIAQNTLAYFFVRMLPLPLFAEQLSTRTVSVIRTETS